MLKHLKILFLFLLCIALGVGIGASYVWWKSHTHRGFEKNEGGIVVTGIGDAPAHRGFTVDAARLSRLDTFLQQTQTLFATTVGIEYGPALTRATLSDAVAAAHRRHMAVALLPPPAFAAQNPFPRPLADIAADAQAAQVDVLCISWLAVKPDMTFWTPQARQIHGIFSGKIILAAAPDILPQIETWDGIDLLGAIGPFTLARRLPDVQPEATLHDLRVAWSCSLGELESLARVNDKKLALLHMNVPATISSRLTDPDAAFPAATPDLALQQLAYQALLLETKGRAADTDMLLFNWSAAGDPDAPPAATLPALLARIGDAWDPSKPKPTENPSPPSPAVAADPIGGADAAADPAPGAGADGAAGGDPDKAGN